VEYDAKGHRAVFENLAHDFPTRISYQRVARDRLTILVSGPGEDGNEQVLTYALRKQ
jgi:tagatose-1,6-bisphosphate aldolase non-catalytic subunit AgaZ/GatZ